MSDAAANENSKRTSVARRLVLGVAATATGPIGAVLIQVASVPIFLHFWGPALYGEWLLISAIPAYLSMSDFGFGNVTANEMTMRVAAGDRRSALETFQSVWLLVLSISSALCVLIVAAVTLLPVARWFHFHQIAENQVGQVLIVLSVYVLVGLQTNLFSAGFRCDGHYALGTLWTGSLRPAEVFAGAAAVCFGARPISVAFIFLAVRTVGTIGLAIVLRRVSPWVAFRFEHACFACARRLFRPAVAFIAIPAGTGLSMQGMIIAIGAMLGPIAVVMFSTLRTLARTGLIMSEAVKNSIWPEISMAFGAGDQPLVRKLHRIACQAALLFPLLASALLVVFGRAIYSVWTHGTVTMDVSAFHLLLAVTVANAFWMASSVVPLATNRHERVAIVYLLSIGLSLLLATSLLRRYGIAAAAGSLLAGDLIMGVYVLHRSLRDSGDVLKQFASSLIRVPNALSAFRLRFPRLRGTGSVSPLP